MLSDAGIKCAYFHDPVKWQNPKYPKYPKPDVRNRLTLTSITLVEVTVKDVLGGRLERDGFNVLLVPVAGISPERFDHYCSLFGRGATDLPVEGGRGGGGRGGAFLKAASRRCSIPVSPHVPRADAR